MEVTAHPRAGGENHVDRLTGLVLSGSSPRGRGKRLVRNKPTTGIRLIPARAGKTPDIYATPLSATAHPRAGGENHEHGR